MVADGVVRARWRTGAGAGKCRSELLWKWWVCSVTGQVVALIGSEGDQFRTMNVILMTACVMILCCLSVALGVVIFMDEMASST